MQISVRVMALSGVFALLACAACSPSVSTEQAPPSWLADRAAQQATLAAKSDVVHGFRYSDRLTASGIGFINRIVDDAGRSYKAVHYDHGMGVCAADVDGDGATDLYFVTQLGTSELWKNDGNGNFTDITESSGLRAQDPIGVGCAFGDIDNDGRPDLFVTTVRHGNRLYRNAGGGRFEDITAAAGVGYVGHSSGAVFFDYDNDGLLDLFVTNVGVYTTDEKGFGGYYIGRSDAFHGHLHSDRTEASILYRNLGAGRFKDVSRETGLIDTGWSGDATVVDVNDDGFPDLYVLSMQGGDHLWLNDSGRRFSDATAKWFPRTPWGSMGVKAFDFDGDARQDLLITDMHSDMFVEVPPTDWLAERQKSIASRMPAELFPAGQDPFIFGNALFTRPDSAPEAHGAFGDVSDRAGVETFWPWGPSVDDLNADGWDDVFIINGMNFPYRYAPNSVLLNSSGKRFLPAEFTLGVEPRAAGVTEQPWFVLECAPGGADAGSKTCAMCASPEGAAKGCVRGADGGVTMMGTKGSRSAVLVDVDGDGDLDIVTNEFNAPPQILISNLADASNVGFLKVRLQGTRSNAQGIGARVTVVRADGKSQLKVADGKSGYLSQSDLPLYFGLAGADHAVALEVRWPSGRISRLAGPIKANQTLTVKEP